LKSTRDELKKLAASRLQEAKVLWEAGLFDGAYYLAGLCVECALKACIAKKTQRYDFPDLETVRKSWIHDLEKLLGSTDLQAVHAQEIKVSVLFAQNWTIVKEWKVEDRYKLGRTKQAARDLYQAVAARRFGVLAWIKKHW
jgi:hypothetical protein